jgi:hypothetical protein
MAKQIVSNDKEVGATILEYERAKFKLRHFFPSMTAEELDRMSGAFVNVASATLRAKIDTDQVKPVTTGTKLKDAIVGVMGGKVMHTSEITAALEAKGAIQPSGKSYVAHVLSHERSLFVRVKAKGLGFYRVTTAALRLQAKTERKAEVKAAAPKKAKPRKAKAKAKAKAHKASKAPTVTKDEILRMLVNHGASFTGPEVAKALGIDNTQRLVPLFNSLKEKGGLKQKKRSNGEILWIPVASKIRAYDAERGGTAFNGVATA